MEKTVEPTQIALGCEEFDNRWVFKDPASESSFKFAVMKGPFVTRAKALKQAAKAFGTETATIIEA